METPKINGVPRAALCKCGSAARANQRTCRACHAKEMKTQRRAKRKLEWPEEGVAV